MPPPYIGIFILSWAPSSRRLSGSERSISVSAGSHWSWLGMLKSSTSKPPPEAPILYSKPLSGTLPVSAISQVARIRSCVQRLSPKAGGASSARGQWAKPLCRLLMCFSTMSCSSVLLAMLAIGGLRVAQQASKGICFQSLHEHGAAHLAAQTAHFTQAHRAEDL